MNISGIRPSDGFYEKNINKAVSGMISSAADSKVEEGIQVAGNDRDIAASLSISEAGKVAAKNIAKAVGDMEKDTAIHRYQYLVKTNTEVAKADDKGLENFTL
ncbi:hypothetical protein SAMN04487831_102205 [Pseudobutyrivibrio sp. UC1225]|uniref:hypothetical protein n=1 Tax=Pseudobutyrivibrio sp. UC1225 TaxID=1798185 RepID=UPI0008E9F6FD|nr:hypothetical protein [Pseudobutyrivibrio sp. UC1225]SFN62671.1 hypothetical protein SAMN04487831_102205 [Pseudobutyrivibrio sp. UC1225]